jgi:hypothetical protein
MYPGYTTNISTSGMFLATNSPQPPGTRLRIEVLEGDRGFIVEGVVAHARKTRSDLMRLTQPGMGIRFLAVEELVRELIPIIPGETEEIPQEPAASRPMTQSVAPPSAAPAPVGPASSPAPRLIDGSGAFSMGFLGPNEFLEVYQRDIVNGGLFVSTRYPGRLQETVRIELRPPVPGAASVFLSARVVQRFEPQEGSFGPNLLSGMGVEILDLPAVLAELRPVVEKLKG